MTERDPIADIVDIKTLADYTHQYVCDVVEREQNTWGLRLEELWEEDETPVDDKGHWDDYLLVCLRDLSWDELPGSLQIIMKKQYDAAQVEERKIVDIRVLDNIDIELELRSSSVSSQGYDLFGEHHASSLMLRLADAYKGRGKQGEWFIDRLPLGLMDKLKRGSGLDNVEDSIQPYIQNIPATKEQLQDVARLLEENKGRARVLQYEMYELMLEQGLMEDDPNTLE